jgi:hypothetical protein
MRHLREARRCAPQPQIHRSKDQPNLRLFHVDSQGLLREAPAEATRPETLDVSQFPYGAVVLPWTGGEGEALVVFKQPSC